MDCERDVGPHEGPQTAREYRFNTREVSASLAAVAGGETYKRASIYVRDGARRSGRKPHGQLVADWVEMFSEPLWVAHGPARWPDVVICDEIPIQQRTIAGTSLTRWPSRLEDQRRLPKVDAFTILAVCGQMTPRDAPQPWFAWAVGATASKRSWMECLSQLGGRPRMVVSDLNPRVFNAAETLWPVDRRTGEASPRRLYCLHHVKESFPWPDWASKAAAADDDRDPHPLHDDYQQLRTALDRCAHSEQAWHDFEELARELAPSARLDGWFNRMDRSRVVAEQLRLHRRGEPLSNSSVEAFGKWLRQVVKGRPFANKTRTNRLLRLMVLNRRGSVDDRAWSQTIRESALANGGRPGQLQRSCTDPLSNPSLR